MTLPSAALTPDPNAPELIQGTNDLNMRLTVPVTINGAGPYHFVVDTAAERTVISRELASRLALGPGKSVTVLSVSGYDQIDTAIVPMLQLTSGRNRLSDLQAPVMEESDLGASGLLGIDSLRSKRVVMDFRARRMTIVDSGRAQQDKDEIVVTARSKFGQLILLDASANGMKVNVIIDTGSQVSIANPALRAKLEKRRQLGTVTPISILSVTGGRMAADYTTIAHIRLGSVNVDGMPVAFADAQIFHRLGLSKKPAILLGMDVLSGFDRVSVDYANRTVRFLLPGEASQEPSRMANTGQRAAG
ncbi:MAG: aspartyl protease family protein [Sphingomonas sp.]|nr:aspartyl protease family protein [Sphingomonas sp.]